MKGIELTQSQIKAYEAGATMFLFPIKAKVSVNNNTENTNKFIDSCFDTPIEALSILGKYFPVQKGDKDIFVKEDFVYSFDQMFQICGDIYYKAEEPDIMSKWTPALQMPKEQSRYSFSECIDVMVVRVNDIDFKFIEKIVDAKLDLLKRLQYFIKFYNQQMQEQGINRTYEDNDYVFLVEFRR